MKIAVYGATGMVGSQIVAEAVRRGHEVTAFSRGGGEVAGVPVQQADLGNVTLFDDVAANHDAVVLATGPSRTGEPHSVWLDAMRSAIMHAGNTRLMVVGGAGSLLVDGVRLVDSPEFPDEVRPEALSVSSALEMLSEEAPETLNWVAVSPAPMIEPGERTGRYRTADDSPAGNSISTQDFAVALLDELDSPAHHRTRFTVAN